MNPNEGNLETRAKEITPKAFGETSEKNLRFLATFSHLTGGEPLKL